MNVHQVALTFIFYLFVQETLVNLSIVCMEMR